MRYVTSLVQKFVPGKKLRPAVRDLAVPAEVSRPAMPVIPAWPADREPNFVAWWQYNHRNGRGLVDWVRHRFIEPAPHVVYVLRLGEPTAVYVGITNDLPQRMRAHARSAFTETRDEAGELLAINLEPNKVWIMRHGLDRVENGRAVPEATIDCPDRLVAMLVEVNVSCILAAAGFAVFGQWLDNLCPGAEWSEPVPYWDRNTIRTEAALVA